MGWNLETCRKDVKRIIPGIGGFLEEDRYPTTPQRFGTKGYVLSTTQDPTNGDYAVSVGEDPYAIRVL